MSHLMALGMGMSFVRPNTQAYEEDRWREEWCGLLRNPLLAVVFTCKNFSTCWKAIICHCVCTENLWHGNKDHNSYFRAWGHGCGHFPGLLIRFVDGVEIAAMWWMILGSHSRDKPGKHYHRGVRVWAWSLKRKILSTSMPSARA